MKALKGLLGFLFCFALSLGITHAQPPWIANGYLTCNENFVGPTLNTAMWDFSDYHGGPQFYGNDAQDVEVPWNYKMLPGGGVETFIRHQNFPVTQANTQPYTSTRLTTHEGGLGCGIQLYGWYEIKAQFSPITGGANGIWPALWFLNAIGGCQWEIDLSERFTSQPNNPFDHTWSTATLHNGCYTSTATLCTMQDANGWASQPHVWALDWEPSYMSVYIDGVLCTDATNNPTGVYTGSPAAIPATAAYFIHDDIMDAVSNIAQEQQLNTPDGGGTKLFWYRVYQMNGNTQQLPQHAQITSVPFVDKPVPQYYSPGDTINITAQVTAGVSGASNVFMSAALFDWCQDNGSSFSPCMYPYNNAQFGSTTDSSTLASMNANQTTSFNWTYTIPTTIPSGYLYSLAVSTNETSDGSSKFTAEIPIQVGPIQP